VQLTGVVRLDALVGWPPTRRYSAGQAAAGGDVRACARAMQALGAAGYAFTSVASREQSKRGRLIYGRQCVSARGVWIASSGIEPSGAWAMSAAKVNGCDIGIFAASWVWSIGLRCSADSPRGSRA